MNIGDVIASTRRKKRIDQKQMAKDLEISPSYLSQIENGNKNPSAKLLTGIAELLDLPVSVLLFEVLEGSDFKKDHERELFLKAKPMMDKMIALLLSDDTRLK